jgi:beta-lactamase class A
MKKVNNGKNKASGYIPFIYVIVFHAVIVFLAVWLLRPPIFCNNSEIKSGKNDLIGEPKINSLRENQFRYTKPLRLAETEKESTILLNLKERIGLLISDKVKSGALTAGSVYVNDLNSGGWISINEKEQFKAGSINKVSILLYYLKTAEKKPDILNNSIVFKNKISTSKHETFPEQKIIIGKSYTIRELIERMVIYSDNDATLLLLKNMTSAESFRELFAEFGLEKPAQYSDSYSLNVEEISRFLKVLYNGTFLGPELSDYALKILSKSSFNQGLTKHIPENIVVAHKFGESGDLDQTQLSETGIVYTGDHPYLITVMTKGNNIKLLAETISEVSKIVFFSLTN